MPEFNKNIFQKRIKELREGLTQKEFAQQIGISHTLISDYEKGRTKPTTEILDKFVNNAKVNLLWLFTGIGNKFISDNFIVKEKSQSYGTKFKDVPLVGSVGCGMPLHSWNEYGNDFYSISNAGHLSNPFILKAKGDSMIPYINQNDLLLCSDEPQLIKNGRAVIVSFKTEPDTQESNAKLIKYLSNDLVMLYSVNTKYEPIIIEKKQIYHIYKLIRIIREVK